MHSWQFYTQWKLAKQQLPVLFSPVQISRWDPSYPGFQILWWVPVLTSTQWKLHPRSGDGFWIVAAVATGETHSERHNTSLGIAIPTPSHYVGPIHPSCSFLCIDKSAICIHHLNPQHKPDYHGKYRARLLADVHPIDMSCYDSYAWWDPMRYCILSHGALRFAYCQGILWSLCS